MIEVTITDVQPYRENGFAITWGNGSTSYFNTIDEMKQYVGELEDLDTAQKFLLSRGINVGNDFAQPNVVEGKTLELDVSANNPITIK